jgi:hypothetical protein
MAAIAKIDNQRHPDTFRQALMPPPFIITNLVPQQYREYGREGLERHLARQRRRSIAYSYRAIETWMEGTQ